MLLWSLRAPLLNRSLRSSPTQHGSEPPKYSIPVPLGKIPCDVVHKEGSALNPKLSIEALGSFNVVTRCMHSVGTFDLVNWWVGIIMGSGLTYSCCDHHEDSDGTLPFPWVTSQRRLPDTWWRVVNKECFQDWFTLENTMAVSRMEIALSWDRRKEAASAWWHKQLKQQGMPPRSHDPGKQSDKHDGRQWNKAESHRILWNIQGVFPNFVRTLLYFLEHHGIFQNNPKKEMEYS